MPSSYPTARGRTSTGPGTLADADSVGPFRRQLARARLDQLLRAAPAGVAFADPMAGTDERTD